MLKGFIGWPYSAACILTRCIILCVAASGFVGVSKVIAPLTTKSPEQTT